MTISAPGPLGFITESQRTVYQHNSHTAAEAGMVRHHGLPQVNLRTGQSVRLFDAWRAPKVVADVGFVFPRFHQLTGSCVGAGGGQALFTLIAVQRLLAENPTKAFIPFWPFDYGRCRYREGDRGQGEGAMGSSFAQTVAEEGVIAASGPDADPDLPQFQDNDGLVLTNRLELQWSDGGSQTVTSHMASAKRHPVGSASPCRTFDDVWNAVGNGYPVTWACDNFIGHATVQGSGADARVVGYWDGRGGHQQSVHAIEQHPQLGRIVWVQNNWPGQTYPQDPGGGPVCGCWVTEAKVNAAFRLHSEVYALSHLTWFPAQPEVVESWADLIS